MSDAAPTRIGPYTVLGELGRGGMGVVYRVRREDLDREFALKLVIKSARLNPSMMKRLEREAQAAARLAGHPGIVGVHDAGVHDDSVYLVMDCVEGRSLDQLLREETLAPDQAAALIAETARATAHAHDNGVLHRDIKPANIMVTPDGRPRLTDFGLARSQQADHDVSRLTQSDEVLGTPAYMPPEQACGEALDARADVYALGASLYECLAGRPPFDGSSIVHVLTAVLREPPRPLAQTAPGTPAALQRIVAQCLAKRREDRYPSAAALAEDLERFRRGDPVEARAARRAPKPLLAFGATVLIFGGGVAALGWALSRTAVPVTGPNPEQAAAATAAAERRRSIAVAWRALSTEAGTELRQLMATQFGAPATPGQRAQWQAVIDRVAAAVAAKHSAARSPEAWKLLARHLAHDPEALPALRALAEQPLDDPFPKAVLALALVIGYARMNDIPQPTMVGRRMVLPERHIPPALAAARKDAATALDAMSDGAAWMGITEGSELRDLAAGANLLAREQPAEAAAMLEAAFTDPTLEPLARLLCGLSRAYAGNLADAARELDHVARRGWIAVASMAATCHMGTALEESLQGRDSEAHFAAALGVLDAAGEVAGDQARFDPPRYSIALARARLKQALGQDSRAELREASRILEGMSQSDPGYAMAHGRVLRDLASLELSLGNDPLPLLERAVQKLGTAIARFNARAEQEPVGPWRLNAQRATESLGRTQVVIAQYQHRKGDPRYRRTYAAAIETFERLLQDTPDRGSTHNILSDTYVRIARITRGAERAAAWAKAAEHAAIFVRLTEDLPHPRAEYAKILVMWAEADIARADVAAARLEQALVLLDRCVADQPREWSPYDVRSAAHRLRARLTTDLAAAVKFADAAVADAQAAIRLSEQSLQACQGLVYAHHARTLVAYRAGGDPAGCYADAVSAYETARAKHDWMQGDARTLNVLGEAAEYASLPDDAIAWYRRAANAAPTWALPRQRAERLESRKR
ncbi:MAG: serine/threonine-protein kinase [Planctomycetota bacterium]|jgi:tetratricopeptide (TPR) repeat protein